MSAPGVALVGFMCSGKSTVGRLLAAELGLPFEDTDSMVERKTGMQVADIFAAQGEPGFRKLEREAVAAAAKHGPMVLATGGGAPTDTNNVEGMRRVGPIAWLGVRADTVLRRAGDRTTRPLLARLSGADLESLVAERALVYSACADFSVHTDDLTPNQVADELLAWLRSRPS